MRPDGSGTLSLKVELQPAFADWLQTMGEEAKNLGLKKEGGPALFDEASIRQGAASFRGVAVKSLQTPSRERLEMTLELADITALSGSVAAGGGPALVSLDSRGNRRILRVYLDAASYAALRPLMPGLDNQLLDVLGPQANNPYDQGEYDDVLAFTVGDDAPKWARASRIAAIVRVPGRIVSQTGGRIEGAAVRFDIPLLDVLLLSRPLVYTIEYELAP